MKSQIEKILSEVLPKNSFWFIRESLSLFDREPQLAIIIAASSEEINRVRGQYPQVVSLLLNVKTLELRPQAFGGNGGQFVYRQPDMNHPKEKYLAMQSIKIPFRKPKPEARLVLNAIENFAQKWVNTLKDNKDKLMYQHMVDYDTLLK